MPKVKTHMSTVATDPLRNFKFHVNIHHQSPGGSPLIRLGFMGASGLSAATDPIPYREGGMNTTTRKLPGQTNFSDISLARGVILGTKQSWQWFTELFAVQNGNGLGRPGGNFRANMDIKVLDHPVTDRENVPSKMLVKVYNAWPISIAYSDLDAGGNAVLIEQMTLTHEGWEVFWADSAGTESLG